MRRRLAPMVSGANEPEADMSLVEISQCGGLLAHRGVLSFGGSAGVLAASRRFRTIQACPKDLRAPLREVECAVD